MDRKNILIGALALLVLITAWLWLEERKELENVLARFETETRDYRAEIDEKCGNGMRESDECRGVLAEFSEMLADYQAQLEDADVPETGTSTQ